MALSLTRALRDASRRLYDVQRDNLQLESRLDVAVDPLMVIRETTGDSRLRTMNDHLGNGRDGFGIVRSMDQRRFHRRFTEACLPLIYGSAQWSQHAERVMRRMRIQAIRSEVFILTPRRWGKTYSVASYVAALLMAVPGIQIAVFSTASRASGSLKELVVRFINNTRYGARRIVRNSGEQLFLAMEPLPVGVTARSSKARDMSALQSTAKLFCYPGSVDSTYYIQCSVLGKRVASVITRMSLGLGAHGQWPSNTRTQCWMQCAEAPFHDRTLDVPFSSR